MKFKILIFITLTSLLSGCVPLRQPVSPPPPLNSAEFSKFLVAGTASIQGQVFMRTRSGSVIYGAGSTVLLIPLTDYTKQRLAVGFDANNDLALSKYIRRAIADANGNFDFTELPEGEYVAISSVVWQIPWGRT